MKRNLQVSKKLQIARTVLEGLHGFQYRWPERIEVKDALYEIAQSDDAILVMLRGADGAGISSVLEEFSSAFREKVVVVHPRIYTGKLNMIGQVLHAYFPLSSFRSYDHVPQSLMQLNHPSRKILILDDLDIISGQNNLDNVVFSELCQLVKRGRYTILMSTRNRRLLATYSAIKGVASTVIPVSGIIQAADVGRVVQEFFEWCNQQYETQFQYHSLIRFNKLGQDTPIDRIIYGCEVLYCSELLNLPTEYNMKSCADFSFSREMLSGLSELRSRAERKAFF